MASAFSLDFVIAYVVFHIIIIVVVNIIISVICNTLKLTEKTEVCFFDLPYSTQMIVHQWKIHSAFKCMFYRETKAVNISFSCRFGCHRQPVKSFRSNL